MPGGIVFNRQKDKRKVIGSHLAHDPLSVRHGRCSIGQEVRQGIRRQDLHTDVDKSFSHLVPEMHHVPEYQVTSCGNLHFDADTDLRPIHDFALSPIDIAGRLSCPARDCSKLSVNHLSQNATAVCVAFWLDDESECGNSFLDFLEKTV